MKRRGLLPVHDSLLIVWIMLLGADRVNLLEGIAFVLTPFLVLTPLVVSSEWIRWTMGRRARGAPVTAVGYAVACSALLGVVLASVLVSPDPGTSASRAALLALQLMGTFVVVVLASDRADLVGFLGRACVWGVVLFVAADLLTLATWFRLVPETLHAGPVTVDLASIQFTDLLPRLSGPGSDPNRSGWLLLFLGSLVAVGERRPRIRLATLITVALLMLITLSRSTFFAAFVAIVIGWLDNRRPLRIRMRSLAVFGAVSAVCCTALLISPPVRLPNLTRWAPLSERFTIDEGSGKDHFTLLQRGIDEATSSVPRTLMGIGYGSSYVLTQDVLPGNRHGNFHSFYVTMFGESGLFALLLACVLVGWPLVSGGPYRPLIASAAVFNVFNQVSAEPSFWLALALGWIFARAALSAGRSEKPASAQPADRGSDANVEHIVT
jgi:hypothetical protein